MTFRVVFVSATTSFKEFENVDDARASAAQAIKEGTAAQVGIEERNGDKWSLIEGRSNKNIV